MPNKNEEKGSTTELTVSSNMIAQETVIIGDIVSQGTIRIDGQLEGSLESTNKIIVGDSGQIKGNISALEAEVSGQIDGKVQCSGTLFLKKTAFITGDIFAAKLIIENGALFNGKCHMTDQVDTGKNINHHAEREKKVFAG